MFEDISKIIIFSDMDGTLLDSHKKIKSIDLEAVKRFRQLGGKFTIATGRTIQSFRQYADMLEIKSPVIMYNGAAIYDYTSEKTLFTHPLPEEAGKISSEILSAMPEAGGEVLRTDGTYIFRNNDYEQLHTNLCGITPEYMELEDIPSGDWLKVLFAMSPEDIPHMELLVRQKGYDTVDFVRSADIFLEMLPCGVSKGSALAQYRRLDGMEGYTFVAIGDFDNDLEMIREADLGVCPANAEDTVKKASDLVLSHTNDEGAVAELINYITDRCSL